MVPNDALINFLRRNLKYRFKRETERTRLYKAPGRTHRVSVRKTETHSRQYARSVLRSAGASEDAIQRFLSEINH